MPLNRTILDRNMEGSKWGSNGAPPELWFKILMYLPPEKMEQMRQINSGFNNLISGSEEYKFRRTLFFAGLEETVPYDRWTPPHDRWTPPRDRSMGEYKKPKLSDLVEAYRSRWENLGSETGLEPPPGPHNDITDGHRVSFRVVGLHGETMTKMGFDISRFPSPSMGIEPRRVFETETFCHGWWVDARSDLLVTAVPSEDGSTLCVKLHNMSDGTLVRVLTFNIGKKFTFATPQLTRYMLAAEIHISGSSKYFVWNWRDEQLYLDNFSAAVFTFIDEYRLLAVGNTPALVLLDFSVRWKPGMKPTKFKLELENSGIESIIIERNYKSPKNTLPFREDPSAGIIGLLIKDETGQHTFVISVEDLAGLRTPGNGKTSLLDDHKLWPNDPKTNEATVPWDYWKHFLEPVEPPAAPETRLIAFQSQLVYLVPTDNDLFLHVYDFPPHSRIGMAGGHSSNAPLREKPPPYVIRDPIKLPDRPPNHSGTFVTATGIVYAQSTGHAKFFPFRLVVKPTPTLPEAQSSDKASSN